MTSSATSHGTCRLLKLPAELRLLIYEYALHAPNGVVCKEEWDHTGDWWCYYPLLAPIKDFYDPDPTVDYSTTEGNQLKYVCRQLNTETKGLTFSVNEIIFHEFIATLIDFHRVCPPAVLENIRIITIMASELLLFNMSASGKTTKANDFLCGFCVQYPQVIVRLRHEYLHPEEDYTILNALKFQICYRNNSSLIDEISKGTDEHVEMLAVIANYKSHPETKLVPENLRLYPPFVIFNEQSFIKYMQKREIRGLRRDSDGDTEMFEEDIEMSAEESETITRKLPEWYEQAAVIKKIFEHGV